MHPARKRGVSYIGTVLGEKYRLETPIGEGGMATVWLARHLTLDRAVAVKFIHVSGDPEAVRERFLREARVAAAVSHRNVVDIIDFGATDEGQPYMVMEYLEGATLRELLDRMPAPPVGDVVRIVARSLSGLAAVHEAGIVHRDIKPANIFLVRDADGTYPKLLDFGVSRVVDGGGQSVLPTHESVITGTPEYMAPEQARGQIDIGRQADLYGMGVVLYEALTGRVPYRAEHVGEVITKILTEDFTPLDVLRPDLGEPMARVVSRALAKEPSARFEDAREMRQALLEAAARTAKVLADGDKPIGGRIGDSIFPVSKPQELIQAVDDVYEPEDYEILASSLPPRSSAAPTEDALAIPKPPKVPSPIAPPAPVIEETAAAEPPTPPPPRRRASRAVVIVGIAALGAALALYTRSRQTAEPEIEDTHVETPIAQPETDITPAPAEPAPVEEPEPMEDDEPAEPVAETVSVTLTGVPRNAAVTVDGEPHEGPITFPRAEVEHTIEVRAPRRAPFRVTHLATSDGAYEVELRRARPDRRPRRGGMIFSDPGF